MFRVWETGFTAEGAGIAEAEKGFVEDETVTGITLTPALSRERADRGMYLTIEALSIDEKAPPSLSF